MPNNTLPDLIKQVEYYRMLGEKALAKIPDEKLDWQHNAACNSAATIVKHLWGNMLSRWTDFSPPMAKKPGGIGMLNLKMIVNPAKNCFRDGRKDGLCYSGAQALKEEDLGKVAYDHHQRYLVQEAINRQLAYYSYHVGHIVMLGKMLATD